jgi:hypothetical protein
MVKPGVWRPEMWAQVEWRLKAFMEPEFQSLLGHELSQWVKCIEVN